MAPPGATLFLCYARGDDEPFVKRLHDDLQCAGFRVWFDRESLLSRGLTYHQEIKDAIRAKVDRLVYVGGPKAALSPHVREEWQFALECDDVVVTPILRLGGIEHVPGELSLLHCEDFRDDAHYDGSLRKLIASLREPHPRLGGLFAVPSLPANFLGRPELMRRVREALLVDLQTPVVVTSCTSRVGVQGMGGIGKSVLAAAFARDRRVRCSYPDGVVWVSFGRQPDVAQLMRDVAVHLGDPGAFVNAAQGQGVLRDLLRRKAVLLVLDDVWTAADAQAFDVLGPRCRALITTRDAGILHTLHSELYPVDLFTEGEALACLAASANCDIGALPSPAREIVRECGRLPLAIALCGGMVRRDVAWDDILERLRHAELDRIGDRTAVHDDHRNLWRVMQVSFAALSPIEQSCFTRLGVFPTDEPVPASAIRLFWKHGENLTAGGADDMLSAFSERALVHLDRPRHEGAAPGESRVSLHDLVHDFAVRRNGDVQRAHAEFADAALGEYARDPTAFRGYVKRRLPEHLVAAQDVGRLLTLLTDRRLDYFHEWAEQGNAATGIHALEFLVTQLQAHPTDADLVPILASQLARLHNRIEDPDGAERWAKMALADQAAADGTAIRVQAVAMHEFGSMALMRGDIRKARTAYRKALRLSRSMHPPLAGEIAANLIALAVTFYLGDWQSDRTLRLASLALDWATKADDRPHAAEACRMLADVHKDVMNYAQATTFLARGLAIAERAELGAARLSLLTTRAWMTYQRTVLELESPEAAEAAFRDLLAAAEKQNVRSCQCESWSGLGQVALMKRDRHELEACISHLDSLTSAADAPYLRARWMLLQAGRELLAGHLSAAADIYARAASLGRTNDLWSRTADALVGEGVALFHDGRVELAEARWVEAEGLAIKCSPIRRATFDRCRGRLRTAPIFCPL